jgi:hypothetical protein
LLDADEPAEKIVYKIDTVYIERKWENTLNRHNSTTPRKLHRRRLKKYNE